jgi:hypothetical protein
LLKALHWLYQNAIGVLQRVALRFGRRPTVKSAKKDNHPEIYPLW